MSKPPQVLFPCHSTQWIHSLRHQKSCSSRTCLRHSLDGLRKISVSSCWHFLGMVSPLNGINKLPVTILGLNLQHYNLMPVRVLWEYFNCLSFTSTSLSVHLPSVRHDRSEHPKFAHERMSYYWFCAHSLLYWLFLFHDPLARVSPFSYLTNIS